MVSVPLNSARPKLTVTGDAVVITADAIDPLAQQFDSRLGDLDVLPGNAIANSSPSYSSQYGGIFEQLTHASGDPAQHRITRQMTGGCR